MTIDNIIPLVYLSYLDNHNLPSISASCQECVDIYVNYCVYSGWINQNSCLGNDQDGDEVELLEDA